LQVAVGAEAAVTEAVAEVFAQASHAAPVRARGLKLHLPDTHDGAASEVTAPSPVEAARVCTLTRVLPV
jgi:hypothetical protein